MFTGALKKCQQHEYNHSRQEEKSLNHTNMSSRSPTKDLIIAKSQAIADKNCNQRKDYKLAKIDKDE